MLFQFLKSLFRVFERVTAQVDNKVFDLDEKEMEDLLKTISKKTNIEFHNASFGFLISGSFEQVASLRQYLQKVLNRNQGQLSSGEQKHSSQLSDITHEKMHRNWTERQKAEERSSNVLHQTTGFTDEDSEQGYETNEDFMKMFGKAHQTELENIEAEYCVKIKKYNDSKGKVKVKVEPGRTTTTTQLSLAQEKFIALYQQAFKSAKRVRFRACGENLTKLRQIIHDLKKRLPVLIDKAGDRLSYQIYGEEDAVERALQTLHSRIDIKSDDCETSSFGTRTLSEQPSIFDAEEAMELDNDPFKPCETYIGRSWSNYLDD